MPSGFAALASPARDSGAGQLVRGLCSPPRRFRAAGGVRSAGVCEGPFGRAPLRGTGAQKAGIRYERKVHAHLKKVLPEVQISPWFRFVEEAQGVRFCQPDAIFLRGKHLFIFEIKVSFTSDAYYQLKELYLPVVELAFGRPVTGLIQVCKHYDPFRPFPEAVRLVKDFSEEALAEGDPLQIGVLTWKA